VGPDFWELGLVGVRLDHLVLEGVAVVVWIVLVVLVGRIVPGAAGLDPEVAELVPEIEVMAVRQGRLVLKSTVQISKASRGTEVELLPTAS
jgi:hypothetical protein